jgi:polyisoprenoid-binding protein YceI
MIQMRFILALFILIILPGCSGVETNETAGTGIQSDLPPDSGEPVLGRHTFVIVSRESTAAYIVDEEFFGLALSKYGIPAGMSKAIGRTQSIEGQFELDPDDLNGAVGHNTFTVRMNTFTSDRPTRDQWIREEGPRFDDYPVATFTAATLEATQPSIRGSDDITFELGGNLTAREISKAVTFVVTARLNGGTLTGVATTRLLMSDFGIDPPNFANTLTAVNEFGIEVRFTARVLRP